MEKGSSIKEEFEKVQRMCLGFEDCINNEDQYFKQAMEMLLNLITEIWRENLFSDNEILKDIDPQNLKYLLIPYYQAET